MATFSESVSEAVRSGFCAVLSGGAEFYDFFIGMVNPLDLPNVNLPRALYNFACNGGAPENPPVVCPPGQCAVGYDVTIQYNFQLNGGATTPDSINYPCTTPENTIFGPIGPLQLFNDGVQTYYYIDAFDSDGNPRQYRLTSSFGASVALLSNGVLTVSRCDGQEDNCGQCAPPVPSPGYNSRTTNITYVDNSSTTITAPITLTYLAPTLDIDNNVYIPVRVELDLPDITANLRFTARFNLSTGDITVNLGGSEGGDDRPGPNPVDNDDDGDGGTPLPGAETPDVPVPENPTTEKVIVGALFRATAEPTNKGVIFGTGFAPDLYTPDLGLVYFKVRAGGRQTAWLAPIKINLLSQFIPCPWSAGAIDIATAFRPGVQGSVAPIYDRKKVAGNNPGE